MEHSLETVMMRAVFDRRHVENPATGTNDWFKRLRFANHLRLSLVNRGKRQ
jgi:hypothetical protein